MTMYITQEEVIEAVVKWLQDTKRLHVEAKDLTPLMAEGEQDHAFVLTFDPDKHLTPKGD